MPSTNKEYHSARLIAIDKQTGQLFAKRYDKTGDTSFFIRYMVVLHDTVHTIKISLWKEQPADIYHFRLYSERLNSQLQPISSHIIQAVDDTPIPLGLLSVRSLVKMCTI